MTGVQLGEIAAHSGCEISGDATLTVQAVAAIEQAQQGEISFINQSKYLPLLADCRATALIASPKLDVSAFRGVVLLHQNPYLAYATTVQFMYPEVCSNVGIHPSAVVSESAVIGKDVSIAANAVIDAGVVLHQGVQIGAGCVIGANCVLHADVRLMANVTLYYGVTIGERSRIHSGVVLGADGFGYAPDQQVWHKIPQIGGVKIGSDVEIGANTTIDRGALNDTIIGDGVIIDNQIQIGHNVIIGDHSALAGATAIAGSTVIGKRCQIGGGACFAGHLNIADDVIITGMSMVTGSIKKAGVYSSGIPVTESKRWRRNAVRFTQLDEMAKSVRQLQQQTQLKDK